MEQRRLLLVGGGHAHVEVVRQLGGTGIEDPKITLVSPDESAAYSGMLPGLIAGDYKSNQTHVDLPALCARFQVDFIQSRVTEFDLGSRVALCQNQKEIHFDVLSINVGSSPSLAVPGVRLNALPVKPVAAFLSSWPSLVERLKGEHSPKILVVVGGGAGGVELVLAVHSKLSKVLPAQQRPQLHLVSASPHLLPGYCSRAQDLCLKALMSRSIQVHVGRRVREVTPHRLLWGESQGLDYDGLLWATHASAPPWLARTGLALDPQGFVCVQRTLQSTSHSHVYAAGDVASIEQAPCPKAGVYAVRQGPILAENLRLACAGLRPTRIFKPQARFLSLVSLGNRSALASWGPFALESNLMWRLKDWIDRRWMAKYSYPLTREGESE